MSKNAQEKLKVLIQNEPLIINDEAIGELDFTLLEGNESTIFFGVGLCTENEISIGLPFDVLGMIFVAERLRRLLDMSKVIVQIADEHAIKNRPSDKSELMSLANKIHRKLKLVTKNYGLSNFEIFKSSDLNKSKTISLVKSLSKDNDEFSEQYVLNEVSDIEFFRENFNTAFKLSWIIPGEKNRGNDERLFDNLHCKLFGKAINFLHIEPGRSFDKKRWRVPPYIHIAGQNRILLEKEQDIEGKLKAAEKTWGDSSLGGARNFLRKIVRIFESLFGNLGKLPLEEKIRLIINESLK